MDGKFMKNAKLGDKIMAALLGLVACLTPALGHSQEAAKSFLEIASCRTGIEQNVTPYPSRVFPDTTVVSEEYFLSLLSEQAFDPALNAWKSTGRRFLKLSIREAERASGQEDFLYDFETVFNIPIQSRPQSDMIVFADGAMAKFIPNVWPLPPMTGGEGTAELDAVLPASSPAIHYPQKISFNCLF